MLFDQIFDHGDLLERIKRAGQSKDHVRTENTEIARLAAACIQHQLDKRRLHRVQHHADLDRMRGARERQTCAVGCIAVFRRHFPDAGGNFRTHIAFIMQRTVYCSAGYTAQLRDLVDGNSHTRSPHCREKASFSPEFI